MSPDRNERTVSAWYRCLSSPNRASRTGFSCQLRTSPSVAVGAAIAAGCFLCTAARAQTADLTPPQMVQAETRDLTTKAPGRISDESTRRSAFLDSAATARDLNRAIGGMRFPARGGRILPPPSTATRRPDLFAPETVYPYRNNFLFDGAADVRYRTETANPRASATTVGSYVAASRLTAEFVRVNPETGVERGGARIQGLLENDKGGTALNRVRASEAYAFYRFPFPGVSATIRGGQFVIPFGLAAVYDTPLQPIQSLYEKSVGLRVDTGVMLEGEYGLYHYAGSITTGSGPDRAYRDGTPGQHVIAFRLARAVETRYGRFQVGGSLLNGTLPVTTSDYVLPPSGYVHTHNYVNKSRFAGDGEYFLGKLTARGEAIFGADNQNSVYGYFGEANYQFVPRTQAVAYVKNWNFPVRPQHLSSEGAGLNYDLGGGLVLRGLYEFEREVPPTLGAAPTVIRRITVQTRLNF